MGINKTLHTFLAVGLLCAAAFGANPAQTAMPPAPVPAQLLTGRRLFIAYAGINTMSLNAYIVDHTGSPNGLYDQFYAAIKNWPGYQVVSSPADAELAFEIGIRQVRGEDPHFVLEVRDPKTNVLLWAFMENVDAGSGRAASRKKAWDEAVESLVNQVKELSSPTAKQ